MEYSILVQGGLRNQIWIKSHAPGILCLRFAYYHLITFRTPKNILNDVFEHWKQ